MHFCSFVYFYYELLVLILDVFSLFYSSCRFNLTVTKIQQLHHCGHVPLPHPTTTAPSLAKKKEKKKETKQEWSTFMARGHMIGSRGWDADARVVQQRGRVHRDGRRERRGWGGVGGPICCSDRGSCRTRESYWQLIGLRNWHSLKQHLNKSCLKFWRLMLYVSQLSFTDCIILVFT